MLEGLCYELPSLISVSYSCLEFSESIVDVGMIDERNGGKREKIFAMGMFVFLRCSLG
jgi:hypothetical protein